MYLEIVTSAIFPCIFGVALAVGLILATTSYLRYARAKQLKSEEDTEEVTATVLGKEYYTTRKKKGGTTRKKKEEEHYKVSYEFVAEKADGTPCKVHVFGREIDGKVWDRLSEGSGVQVLYLAGRPESCRLKDMAETESSFAGLICLFGCIGFFVAIFGIASIFSVFAENAALNADPGEKPQIRLGSLLGFLLSCCGCTLCGAGHQYLNRNQDNIYGGQVDVDDLSDSEYYNLEDLRSPRSDASPRSVSPRRDAES